MASVEAGEGGSGADDGRRALLSQHGPKQRRAQHQRLPPSNKNAASVERGSVDDERLALLSLVRGDTGGKGGGSPPHSLQRGWSADSPLPICRWQGVRCRADVDGGGEEGSVVTEVNVTSAGLSGTIPTELGRLTDLEVLALGGNALRGSIPAEVAGLEKLETLDLTGCFLTGTLPGRFASPRLARLLLARNAISGRFLGRDRDGDDRDGDRNGDDRGSAPPVFPSLREVRMENNLLTGTLHGPGIVAAMPNLAILSLSDNDLSGLIPHDLGSLPRLRYLYLDANHFVGPLPPRLVRSGGASLMELWVQDNALSGTVPASFARLDDLHDFFVDGNKLTGAIPPDLCGPSINADFFADAPSPKEEEGERNWCDSIACPAGHVAREGMYPCTACPGGEGARIRNPYLGRTGECSDLDQRRVLEVFREATTKGGPWSGVDDWNRREVPVCRMTGISCDARDRVVGIALPGRGLQGRIPDEIGALPFLERLDLSDNRLAGHVPSDLRWTSLTHLDLSGNNLRGVIPPLLCKMEDLNGNGHDHVFRCDRVACPAGTGNARGYRHGVDGEECRPCRDDDGKSPYIGRKDCAGTSPTPGSGSGSESDWKDAARAVARGAGANGRRASVANGLAITFATLFVLAAICCVVYALCQKRRYQRRNSNRKRVTFSRDRREERLSDDFDERRSFVDYDRRHKRRQSGRWTGDERESITDDYSFDPNGHSRYRVVAYRDFPPAEPVSPLEDTSANSEDGTEASWARRSALEFIQEHQGIALSRREKFKRAVSKRLPRRAR